MHTSVRMRIRSTGSASRSPALDKQAQAYLSARSARTKLDRAFAVDSSAVTANSGSNDAKPSSVKSLAKTFATADASKEIETESSRTGNIQEAAQNKYSHFRPRNSTTTKPDKVDGVTAEVHAVNTKHSNTNGSCKLKATLDTPQKQGFKYEGVMDQLRVSDSYFLCASHKKCS